MPQRKQQDPEFIQERRKYEGILRSAGLSPITPLRRSRSKALVNFLVSGENIVPDCPVGGSDCAFSSSCEGGNSCLRVELAEQGN